MSSSEQRRGVHVQFDPRPDLDAVPGVGARLVATAFRRGAASWATAAGSRT